MLGASGNIPQSALDDTVLLGELALDGRLRPVRGVLPCLLAAREAQVGRVVVPEAALATSLSRLVMIVVFIGWLLRHRLPSRPSKVATPTAHRTQVQP